MRKTMRRLFVAIALVFVTLTTALASAPPPPPDPVDPGNPGPPTPIGGTLSVGTGLVFLLTMAAAYGAKKIYDNRRRLEE
jgi:hypothetical protein